MKRIICAALVAVLAVTLIGCSASTARTDSSGNLDLSGWWIQENPTSDEEWMSARIVGNSIEVYWVEDGGSVRQLFWNGTYESADGTPAQFEWTSMASTPSDDVDTSRLSGLGEKTFKYENGTISFDVTVNGESEVIELISEDS